MKAAHGSPPLTRPNRHHSNSPCDRMNAGSRSKSQNQGTTMPPYLRLDSTGEVISYDRPVKSGGHLRTNSGRQGASAGGVRRDGLWGKLMSGLAPQLVPSSNQLDSSRIKNGIAAFDELVDSRQASGSVSMAGKPSHVKMAQASLPHLNRYGLWGSMSPSYAFPPGVFPCHVFQALQSQRDSPNTWFTTSGQFVVKCGVSSLDSSLFDACWKFSAENASSFLHKMGSVPSKNTMHGRSVRCSSVENPRTSCAEKVCARVNDDGIFSTHCQSNGDRLGPRMKTVYQENPTASECTPSFSGMEAAGVNQNQQTVETSSSFCEPSLETVSTQGLDPPHVCAAHGEFDELNFDSNSNGRECLEMGQSTDKSFHSKEVAETATIVLEENDNIATQVKNTAKEKQCAQPPCEGAECREILQEKECYSPAIDYVKSHPVVFSCISDRIGSQSSFDHDDDDDDDNLSFDFGETEKLDHQDAEKGDGKEDEDIWKCFLNNQFCMTNMMSKSKKDYSEEEAEEENPEQPRVPKPCPAVTRRWRKLYSSGPSEKRPSKVRFECGKGKDIVHEYEKGDDESLTVMEMQKARDLTREHKGKAATLLQKSVASCEDDDLCTDGDADGVFEGSEGDLQGEHDKAAHASVVDSRLVCAGEDGLGASVVDNSLLATEEDNSEDDDSDDSDFEEVEDSDYELKDGDDSDDEFVVFGYE